uniref:Stable protein 1 (Fragments) n=1 Tax=Populus euphratica TaxID=75702 RepID=STBP1_POPEU|nr:RecName: Full=Stable protein 1 [Populus euphratica]
GYTHAFESTFESKSGLQEYLDSAALAAFAEGFLPTLSQRSFNWGTDLGMESAELNR